MQKQRQQLTQKIEELNAAIDKISHDMKLDQNPTTYDGPVYSDGTVYSDEAVMWE